jgi:hypothetical protein
MRKLRPTENPAPCDDGNRAKQSDLLDRKISKNNTRTKASNQVLTLELKNLHARLPLALDAQEFPILARNWPLDTWQDLQRRILSEEGGVS